METIDQFDFVLPEDRIATFPLEDRSSSRLMVLRSCDKDPQHDVFHNIGQYLNSGDTLVLNNTKVMKARIEARKKTGGRVELLLVRPLSDGQWASLINGKGPFLPGCTLHLDESDHTITIVRKSSDEPGVYEISSTVDLFGHLESNGELPLPPYFRRRANQVDHESYQTVYAKNLGAVAAPTAGLHFTHEHLARLKAQGINVVEITLHVGPGTFLPMRTNNIADHKMHAEYFSLTAEAALSLNRARSAGGRIIAVGTTSLRVLEHVMQTAVAQGLHEFFPCEDKTNIFIRPGHKFLGADAIITNFHLPRSTLLVLVAAIAGRERILKAYDEAIANGYRFFSYGDACFLEMCQ